MPIYEYRCRDCGAELEKLQKLNDPVLRECPECGHESLVKLVSASSFRLKGGGWYETDFKTGNKKNGVGEATDAADKGGKADDKPAVTATDSKSAESKTDKPATKEDAGSTTGKTATKPAANSSTPGAK